MIQDPHLLFKCNAVVVFHLSNGFFSNCVLFLQSIVNKSKNKSIGLKKRYSYIKQNSQGNGNYISALALLLQNKLNQDLGLGCTFKVFIVNDINLRNALNLLSDCSPNKVFVYNAMPFKVKARINKNKFIYHLLYIFDYKRLLSIFYCKKIINLLNIKFNCVNLQKSQLEKTTNAEDEIKLIYQDILRQL